MNSVSVREFLHSKNWYDADDDWRFINRSHPYSIIVSGDCADVTFREQNGQPLFSFTSLGELQEWYENNIGE